MALRFLITQQRQIACSAFEPENVWQSVLFSNINLYDYLAIYLGTFEVMSF